VVTPLTGLDLGGAFEGYNDSTGANVQGVYRAARWTARAEYIDEHNRRTQVHIRGWYGLAGYYAIPQRVELVGRVEQFDPSNLVATDRSTGYLIGLQYFMRGDNFKILADYEAFRGQALAMGRRGDADVVLSHAPEAERVLVDSGYFVRRRLVMHNEFLVVGPATDPAGLRGLSDAVAAFRRLAERRAPFVSRGDQSGTHQREQLLWKRTGMTAPPPRDGWYVESGQGMGATLQLADEKRAYTLTDRATYLAWRDKLQLVPMVEGDSLLYNVYHVLELNPHNAARINVAGGQALADFIVSAEAQALIGQFGRSAFGQSLFVPDAGKP